MKVSDFATTSQSESSVVIDPFQPPVCSQDLDEDVDEGIGEIEQIEEKIVEVVESSDGEIIQGVSDHDSIELSYIETEIKKKQERLLKLQE